MLETLAWYRRDSTLFQFATKRPIDPVNRYHLPVQVNEKSDFAKIVEPLEADYSYDNRSLAVRPEVLLLVLLISAHYYIMSFRRPCLELAACITWFTALVERS